MPFMTFDDEAAHARPKSELWCATAAEHGAWFHPHHNWCEATPPLRPWYLAGDTHPMLSHADATVIDRRGGLLLL